MLRIWPVNAGPPALLDRDALVQAYAPERERPTLRMNFVASLDGAASLDGLSGGLSDPADKLVFDILRMHCDALLIGAGTLRDEGYGALRLDPAHERWRLGNGLTAHPVLVVVSGSLNLDPGHAYFAEAPVRPVVLTHDGTPPERRAALASVADIVTCGADTVDLAAGLAVLNSRGLGQVLSEGGPRLLGELHAAGVVDELCLTFSPLLAGPGAGRITAGPPSPPVGMRLVHVLIEGDLLLTRYARADVVG